LLQREHGAALATNGNLVTGVAELTLMMGLGARKKPVSTLSSP